MFVGKVVALEVPGLRLELGVVDPSRPGVAEGISKLLFRSIADARASAGGHLPDWLVTDVERNYISPDKVRTLWAPFGLRFCVLRDASEIVGTVHVTRTHETIFTVDRNTCNVAASDFPGRKPERFHHMVNLSVLHELRRARIASAMLDGVVQHFRDQLDGDGLWVRADPPWHAGLDGLGFTHDPSRDSFLPQDAEPTGSLSHAELNARYACDCPLPGTEPFDPEALARRPERMAREKLQYLSFTRSFRVTRAASARARPRASNGAGAIATAVAVAVATGRVDSEAVVLVPESTSGVASLLREASEHDVGVVVRGREQSTARLSAAERGLVLSTEKLTGIVAEDETSVTVRAGTTWSDLVRALGKGALPPVVPGWMRASVGGTLSTGGIGKGSVKNGLLVDHVEELVVVTGDGRVVTATRTQAAWLYDAVLGGLGQVGVVTEVTLARSPLPAPREVAVYIAEVPELGDALARVASAEETWHATAFIEPSSRTWRVVQVIATGAEPPTPVIRGARCVALTPTSAYLEAARPPPPHGTTFLQVLVYGGALDAWLGRVHDALPNAEVQVLPVRNVRSRATRPGSLVAMPGIPAGQLAMAVLVSATSAPGDRAALAGLANAGRMLGVKSLFGGVDAMPDGHRAWEQELGEVRLAQFMLARSLSDPRGVLTRTWAAPLAPRGAAT